ncbi:MAG: DUF3619 family protein [Pseudomonadota bacterium]
MNEEQLGRNIRQALDAGLDDLGGDVAARLAVARLTALEHRGPVGRPTPVLTLARQHPWPGALALLAILAAFLWITRPADTPAEDGSVDILLLTGDIPPQAYADWRLVHQEDVGPVCFATF